MRNLKRALSLTLASVMLLGMMVVGSSAAAGYDDVKETDNVEAIEVLQAVEVMVGDDRGFGPDRPVTRNEMAVVMGKLLNLDYNYYTSTCPFSDVATWARGWVGACAANGIVSGRGNGIYDGESTVTAVEAASMMMRALGYFKYTEDYADGFLTSTVRQGSEIGIFSGVGTDGTTPMTRNQVAQMALNALRTEMVTFTGTPGVDVNGVKVGYRAEYTPRTSTEAKYHAIEGRTSDVASDANHKGQYYIQLGEQLYDGKLRLDNGAIDDFDRPSRYWEYDGKAIGTYVKKELLDKEYVGEVTGKDLYDELGKSTIDNYELLVSIDGVSDPAVVRRITGTDSKNTDYVFNASDLNRNNKATVGATGTGVLTQVFVDPDEGQNGKVWIAIINTYLARATQDYDSRREELPVTGYSIRKDGSANEYGKVAKDGTSVCTFRPTAEDFPVVVNAKENDAFLFTVAKGELQSFEPAEVLSGVQISSFKRNDNVVVDGTTYKFDTTAGFDTKALKIYTDLNGTGVINLKDLTYNVYLDKYSNLIGVEEVDPAKNYVFISALDLNDSNLVNGTADARALFLDGTTDTIRVNMAKSTVGYYDTKATPGGYNKNSILNTWCTYTVNDNGVYTIKQVSVVGADDAGVPADSDGLAQYHQTNAPFDIDKKHITLKGKNAAGGTYAYVYGNEDTVYLTAELDELNNQGGTWGVISGVESFTTGVENVNLAVWTNAQAAEEAEDKGTITTNRASYGVYTLYDGDGIVIGAVVVGEDNGAAKNLVYVHTDEVNYEAYNGKTTSKADGDGLYTWTRDVISNGEKITLTEVSDGDSDLAKMEQYKWYQIKTNANGEAIGVYRLPGVAVGKYDKDLKEASLDRYDDYALDWDNDFDKADKGNLGEITYTIQKGASTVLYAQATDITSRMRMDGRTLYVHTQDDSGFIVSGNVKWLITRWDSNKKQSYYDEGTGAASLKTMIDEINSRHPNNENYTYRVNAIIESGIASSVVIRDEYNDYSRPDVPTTGSGNVTTVLKGSKADATYTVNNSGRLYATFSYQAPSFAAATKADGTANQVHVTVDAYALNPKTGRYDLWAGRTTSVINANLDATGKTQFTWMSGLNEFDPTQDLEFRFVTETLEAVVVKYIDTDNKSIDSMMTSDTTKIVNVGALTAAGNLKAAIDSTKYEGTTGAAAAGAASDVTGVSGSGTLNTTGAFLASSAKNVYSDATKVIDGDEAVTVKLNLGDIKAKTPTYTITLNDGAGTAPNNSDGKNITNGSLKLKDWSINDANKESTVTVSGSTLTATQGVPYNPANITVALSAVAAGYEYTVSIPKLNNAKVVLKNGTVSGTLSVGAVNVTDNMLITKDDIKIECTKMPLAIESASWIKTTMTIVFNQEVDQATAEDYSSADKPYTLADGAAGLVIGDAKLQSDGKTVVLTFAGAELAIPDSGDSPSVTVDGTKIKMTDGTTAFAAIAKDGITIIADGETNIA